MATVELQHGGTDKSRETTRNVLLCGIPCLGVESFSRARRFRRGFLGVVGIFCNRNSIRLGRPRAQVDKLASLGAKGTITVLGGPFDRLSAAGARNPAPSGRHGAPAIRPGSA